MTETGAISRETAIARIRLRLIELSHSDESTCRVAADHNILCKGFNRDTDAELRRRYGPYVGGEERVSRVELERLANHWQLIRQRTEETPVACDVQQRYCQVCRGWNDFSNDELSQYCFELTGVRPRLHGKITLPNM